MLGEREREEEKRATHKTPKRTTVEPDVHTNISDLSLSSAAYKKVDKKYCQYTRQNSNQVGDLRNKGMTHWILTQQDSSGQKNVNWLTNS